MPDLPLSSATPAVVLLPSGRFFTRRVPLAAEGETATQVELALETLSPFPPAQLYHGYAVEPGGSEALVFAAHRRNYSATDTAPWATAAAVLPAFAAWLLPDAAPSAGLGWRRQDDSLEVAAWNGRDRLPQLILTRTLAPGDDAAAVRASLLDEIRRRTGIPPDCAVRELPATLAAAVDKKDDVVITLAGQDGEAVRLDEAQLDLLDVRDKAQLADQRRTARRDLWAWRVFAAACLGIAACAALELGLVGGRLWLRGLHKLVDARAEGVALIQTTQELANRVGEMSSQQLRPFEMLATINAQRPAGVTFVRLATTGPRSVEIEAQTANPGDLRDFEARLKALAEVGQVELRDPRSRDGQTTFVLEVNFKPGYPAKAGGA